jgi:hypothetical protein
MEQAGGSYYISDMVTLNHIGASKGRDNTLFAGFSDQACSFRYLSASRIIWNWSRSFYFRQWSLFLQARNADKDREKLSQL